MDALPIKLQFTRRPTGPSSLFSDQVVFELRKAEATSPMLMLSLTRFKARLRTTENNDGITINKKWFSETWRYADQQQGLFAKSSVWKTEMLLSDGKTYKVTMREKSLFWHRKEQPYTTMVKFYCEGQLVMTLTNTTPRPLFQPIVHCAMDGTIETSITNDALIADMLLFFQMRLFARNK